jgi:hypothetical protein
MSNTEGITSKAPSSHVGIPGEDKAVTLKKGRKGAKGNDKKKVRHMIHRT